MPGLIRKQVNQKTNSLKASFLTKSQRSFLRSEINGTNYPGSRGSTQPEIDKVLKRIELDTNDPIPANKVPKIRKLFGFKK